MPHRRAPRSLAHRQIIATRIAKAYETKLGTTATRLDELHGHGAESASSRRWRLRYGNLTSARLGNGKVVAYGSTRHVEE